MSDDTDIYARLAAQFDETHTRDVQGTQMTYITGEQAATRLNEVLGFMGWSFRVLNHGYIEETEEEWCHGQLTIYGGIEPAVREQFGSQRRNKKRDGSYIEVGMDKKGAATDAFKKCAAQFGVGLYLSHREARAAIQRSAQPDTSGMCATCGENAKVPGGGMTGGRYFCPKHKP